MKNMYMCALLSFGQIAGDGFYETKASENVGASACELPFANGQQWSGELKRGGKAKQLPATSILMDPVGDGQYKLSDLSAGFFSEFGIDKKLETVIQFNCLDVVPKTFETSYGFCKLLSGKWDSTKKQLTIHWSIEYNGVDETTVFTLL
jgi:hypothetical protein